MCFGGGKLPSFIIHKKSGNEAYLDEKIHTKCWKSKGVRKCRAEFGQMGLRREGCRNERKVLVFTSDGFSSKITPFMYVYVGGSAVYTHMCVLKTQIFI